MNEPELTRLKGDLFKGHFAAGGDLVAGDAIFQVDEVIHFQELMSTNQGSGNLRFLLFDSATSSSL